MENIRHKSLIRLLKWIVNLALVVEIALAVGVTLVLINIMYSEEDSLTSSYPITLIDDLSAYQIASENVELEQLTIYSESATIQFTSDSIGYYILKISDVIITFFLAIGITLLARKVFQSLEKNHPFTMENASRLRKIAFLLILFTPYSLIKGLIYRNYITNNISIEGKEFADSLIYYLGVFSNNFKQNEAWIDLNVNFQTLLIGAILLVIAEIFRIGVVMKEDNESII
ncbi:DUF2975 domain-containing protein [Marivirga sp. S37H4]|uniref:DUF2975 domain-containing protein n=1 Tax=Marivirga aurantiaca TaxID=2802615 RepID=A0A935C8Q9_9BACT|nr:DUF2975 domain-containing protein [Marivirga aurantiaca]MBK6265630.1 DUF2975 domain-containing protein [Marivirga aurantiaca]